MAANLPGTLAQKYCEKKPPLEMPAAYMRDSSGGVASFQLLDQTLDERDIVAQATGQLTAVVPATKLTSVVPAIAQAVR